MAYTPYSPAQPAAPPPTGMPPPTPTGGPDVRRRRTAKARATGRPGLPPWFNQPNQQDGPPGGGARPASTGAPQMPTAPQMTRSPEAAPLPRTPLEPEVQDIGAPMASARIPGIGHPGAVEGMTNVRRRRRLV